MLLNEMELRFRALRGSNELHQAFERWSSNHPALAPYAGIEDMWDLFRDKGTPYDTKNPIAIALCQLVQARDDLAIVVLVELYAPSLRNAVGHAIGKGPLTVDELHTEVVDAFLVAARGVKPETEKAGGRLVGRVRDHLSDAVKARTLHRAAERWGYPESLLTDNGAVFTSSPRGNDVGAIEPELLSLGIKAKHSRPYHPQTCGKVERFHQTLKKHLAKQPIPETKKQLQVLLDAFVTYYNETRPHREIGRRTPAEAFAARERSYPRGPMIDCTGYRVRSDKVDRSGAVTIRHRGRLHHIGIGRPYSGWRVLMLVAGLA